MNIRPSRLQTGALAPAQLSWRSSPTVVSPRAEAAPETVHPARIRGSRAPIGCAVCAFPRYGESASATPVAWQGARLTWGVRQVSCPALWTPCLHGRASPSWRSTHIARVQRTNRRIRAREVRVVGPAGEQLGVLTIEAALEQANQLGMDLVEVNPMAKPPVCKIMDYGRFKYEEKKRASEAKKKQVVVHLKEVKLRPKTEEHDYEFKVRNVRRFLEEGNKAKVT